MQAKYFVNVEKEVPDVLFCTVSAIQLCSKISLSNLRIYLGFLEYICEMFRELGVSP